MESISSPKRRKNSSRRCGTPLENGNAHNDLGVAYYQKGDFEKAAEQFGEAARINPSASASKNLESRSSADEK